jgi:AcrR family transcriptional regulator
VYGVHLSTQDRRGRSEVATRTEPQGTRATVSAERIFETAISLADRDGIGSLSMRRIADHLGVVPMALYKHVSNKDEILDRMLDVVIGEIDPPATDLDWKAAVRQRMLSAREALLRHPWAARVFETRTEPGPAMMAYVDSMIGLFRAGGFSIDLTHHVLHTMGSRLFGYTQEVVNDGEAGDPTEQAARYAAIADVYPNIYELVLTVAHDDASIVGGRGCDDRFEFEFALDLLLDGIERIKG